MSRFLITVVAIALVAVVPARRADAQSAPAPRSFVVKGARAEQHPRMRSAIRELEAARVELQRAPHDFGGHRADAVQAVDRAIEQLRIALKYDSR